MNFTLTKKNITNLYRYKLSAAITDPTHSMNVTLSDNTVQKLTATTSDKLINENEPDNRKTIPSIINEKKGVTKKMAIQMMKTSTANNICFIVTDVEGNNIHKSAIPTTPPPTIGLPSKTTDNHPTSSSNPPQSKVRRNLTYEHPGN